MLTKSTKILVILTLSLSLASAVPVKDVKDPGPEVTKPIIDMIDKHDSGALCELQQRLVQMINIGNQAKEDDPKGIHDTIQATHDFLLKKLAEVGDIKCKNVPKITVRPTVKSIETTPKPSTTEVDTVKPKTESEVEVDKRGSPEYGDVSNEEEAEEEAEEEMCDDCEIDPSKEDQAGKEFKDAIEGDASELEGTTLGLSGKIIGIICIVAFLAFVALAFLVFFLVKILTCFRK